MARILPLLGLLLGSSVFGANPPSILNDSNHIISDATADLTVLGISYSSTAGPTSSVLAVNQTCSGSCTTYLDPATLIADATNTTQTEYAAGSTVTVSPSVPYQIINQSFLGYTLAGYEQANYSALMSGGLAYSTGLCGVPTASDYPPVAFVTVLPNNTGPSGPGGSGCGYAPGIEFSIPVDSGSCSSTCVWTPIAGGGTIDISTPSATIEAMSAVLAALKSHHSTWNWGDIKSVLRSTASSWAAGYTVYNSVGPALGYGNINYANANAYSGTIYLQPPGLVTAEGGSDVGLTLYPFVTTRRAGEVIYAFTSRPILPSPSSNSEYTYSQVATLASTYGGRFIYNSNGKNGVQTYNYSPPNPDLPLYFISFTVDNTANLTSAKYSRSESYAIRTVYFRVPAINVIEKLLLLR